MPSSVSAQIGRFTRKTQRQEASTSRPPTGGPSAAAAAPTDAQTPTAIGRRCGGNAVSSSASDVGMTRAAPIACTARKPISTGIDGAIAHAAEASVNTATPMRNSRLRP